MKKIIACIGTFFALVALSTQAKNPYLLQTADRSAMEHWVDSVFESLSPKERIAQLLVITVRNSDSPLSIYALNGGISVLMSLPLL